MNELQRMQYLEAMGIAYYVPRWQLPVAKVSGLCELPAFEADTASAQASSVREFDLPEDATIAAPLSPAPAGAGGDIANVISRLDAIVSAPANEESPAGQHEVNPHALIDSRTGPSLADENEDLNSRIHAISESLKPPAETATFSLALWRAGAELQIIDSRRPGDALPTQALLANILLSTGLSHLNLPKAEHLTWPMVDTHPDKSWAAASEMVNGFFEGRFSAQPVSAIIVFGEDAHRALLGESSHYDQCLYTIEDVAVFNAQVLVLPSLAEILYATSLKPKVWSALLQLASLKLNV